MKQIDVRPVVLEGKHVRLEPMSRDHLEGLFAAGRADEIWPWMPWHPKTRDDFARLLDDALAGQASDRELPFTTIDTADGAVVGSTRFLEISPIDRRLEIGWTWLSPAAQRTVINTEAKYLQLRHCFEALGCVRVELKTDGRNVKSQDAIARIGAVREGVFRKHRLVQHGFQRDSVWFSIIDDEWSEVKHRLEAMLGR